MAAAAHHVGRPEHDVAAVCARGAGDGLGQRKFGDGASVRVERVARGHVGLVMRGHADAALAGGPGQRGGHRVHLAGVGRRCMEPDKERVDVAFGAVGVLPELARVAQLVAHDGQVVVERQEMHAPGLHPGQCVGHAVGMVQLEAQVHQVLRAEVRAHGVERIEHAQRIAAAAQAAFPRIRDAVELGGDAVGQ